MQASEQEQMLLSRGIKSQLKEDSSAAKQKADAIIKNTYRTLMTRGMKGCYIYCTDKETNTWFKEAVGRAVTEYQEPATTAQQTIEVGQASNDSRYEGLTLRLLKAIEVKPYINAVPVYDLAIAAGLFSELQMVDEVPLAGDANFDQYQWVELPDSFRIHSGQFVARVVGESMNKRIPNGSWCLFNLKPAGSRQGKIVLVQHRSIDDPDTGGHYTVKIYQSEKVASEGGGWRHSRITLKPSSTDQSYKPIVLEVESGDEVSVIAEMIAVLG